MNLTTDIPFPHYSQLDPAWGFMVGTERTMCGVVCVKAVLDYYAQKNSTALTNMTTLLNIINRVGGTKINGISHAVEVDIFKNHGLVSWRRNWNAPSANTQWLVENENYSNEQLTAVDIQQLAELAFDSKRERELASINAALIDESPVVASVKSGFGGNAADHQIVIVDRRATATSDDFIIMDPEQTPGSSLRTESVQRFFEYFNDRAIFVKVNNS
jgi:hypothetical protein